MNLAGIVEKEVATYRYGAPITIYDIIVGAEADGYDMTNVRGRDIAIHLQRICDSAEGPYGERDRRSYYRRVPA